MIFQQLHSDSRRTTTVTHTLLHNTQDESDGSESVHRLRFFSPSPCGSWLDSTEIQSELLFTRSGLPQFTTLCLPYHRMLVAALGICCSRMPQLPTSRRATAMQNSSVTAAMSVLIIGGGGGTLAHFLERTLPSSLTIDVIEPEPSVILAGRSFFGCRPQNASGPTQAGPLSAPTRVRWYTEEGISFLQKFSSPCLGKPGPPQSRRRYDVIIIDVEAGDLDGGEPAQHSAK